MVKYKRRIEIENKAVIPLCTEELRQESANVYSKKDGKSLHISSNSLTEQMKEFFKQEGYNVKYTAAKPRLLAKTKLCGIPVKITPSNHSNFTNAQGVVIRVEEESLTSTTNSIKIREYFRGKGTVVNEACYEEEQEIRECRNNLEDHKNDRPIQMKENVKKLHEIATKAIAEAAL